MKLLLTLILVLTSLLYGFVYECEAARGTQVYVPTTDAARAYNTDWCDLMYSELHFQEVPPTIHAECKSRFQWNINRDKRSMRAYALRLNTFTY